MKSLSAILALLFIPLLSCTADSKFGHKKYTEYVRGTLPIIIAAPHGGRLKDDTIADRKSGVLVTDTNTDKLARAVYDAFKAKGKTPHMVICHLKRTKVDCNRSLQMATEGDKQAIRVWEDFQGFIGQAKDEIRKNGQTVLYIDLHAHGHEIQRLELGYLLRGSELFRTGEEFNKLEAKSSLKGLQKKIAFEKLIRGSESLGAMMVKEGFPSVPSPDMKNAGKGDKYFNGGYNTVEHGALKSKKSFSIQIETNWKGVRDSEKNREKFGKALAASLLRYYSLHIK